MREGFEKLFGGFISPKREENLNVGAGFDIDARFINADKQLKTGADVQWDLEETPSPFNENQFRLIVASHVLEHVWKIYPLMDEFYRILKMSGHLVVFVPYWTSHSAWSNPEHVRCFSEHSWMFFQGDMNKGGDQGPGCYAIGHKCDFFIEATILAPHPEFEKDPNLFDRIQHEFNIVREMCVTLRKQ